MKKYTVAVLTLMLKVACEPQPTSIDDIDLEKLEGMQAECAGRAASAAMESFSGDTAWTDLLSVDGAKRIAGVQVPHLYHQFDPLRNRNGVSSRLLGP